MKRVIALMTLLAACANPTNPNPDECADLEGVAHECCLNPEMTGCDGNPDPDPDPDPVDGPLVGDYYAVANDDGTGYMSGVYDDSAGALAFREELYDDTGTLGECADWQTPLPGGGEGTPQEAGTITLQSTSITAHSYAMTPQNGYYSKQFGADEFTTDGAAEEYDLTIAGTAAIPQVALKRALKIPPFPSILVGTDGYADLTQKKVHYTVTGAQHAYLRFFYRDANNQFKTLRCTLDPNATEQTIDDVSFAKIANNSSVDLVVQTLDRIDQQTANHADGQVLVEIQRTAHAPVRTQ